jgi:hypothetical protein
MIAGKYARPCSVHENNSATWYGIVSLCFLFVDVGLLRLRDRRTELVACVALGQPGLASDAGVISVTTFSWNFLAHRQTLFLRK